MRYIDPHAHMVSRTTDDYEKMALAGCRALTEPAFWAGYDRCSAEGFRDYFNQLTSIEPARARTYGIHHFTWLCINPKEAEDVGFAREVMQVIPEFLAKDNVLGIGEIGLNKNSKNELRVLEEHLEIAAKHQALVLVHTPHLEDKQKGTRLIMEAVRNQPTIDPGRVLIDHVEEHTVKEVLDGGFWGGMTLYPDTKCTAKRAADILETCGTERLWMNSACDWGPSNPLSVPTAALELRARGHHPEAIDHVIFKNPMAFLRQAPAFDRKAEAIDVGHPPQ